MSKKLTTGKHSQKMYRCNRCGKRSLHETNHWGNIYSSCNDCSWKHPLQSQATHQCLEHCPDTHIPPVKWSMVSFGVMENVPVGG